MRILVTGATGFIGKELLKNLDFAEVTAISRKKQADHNNIKWVHLSLENILATGTLDDKYDVVIHLAGRAHMLNENSDDPLSEFRKVNKDISVELAKQLAVNGLKRFVFVSSIGVNGAMTEKHQPFTDNSVVHPHSAYALSKYEAEVELSNLAKELHFELVIIRPPLVYGTRAPGNFGKLINLVNKVPMLPFALCKNKRSFISVDNLVDFISVCITHPKAANEVFCISDGTDVSIREFTDRIAKGLNKNLMQLPIPISIFKILGKITGKSEPIEQLIGDLQVDSSKARELLGWTPPVTMAETLAKLKDSK